MLKILYEDNHLIAVVKPHGMLTQGDDTGDASLFDEVKAFIKERDQKPGNVFLGLVHRLDRPVGGIVVFAKTSKGAERLSKSFREHEVEKTYLAVVEDTLEKLSVGDERHIEQQLFKDERTNVVRVITGPRGQQAITDATVLTRRDDLVLVELHPKTGRSHQLRLACAVGLRTPIVGDVKYGATHGIEDGHAIALFAHEITFPHPTTHDDVLITAEPVLPIFQIKT